MKKIFAILLALATLCTATAFAETLTMGSSIDFPPYEYYHDETGEIVGIDVEIAQAIADKLGYELEIVDMQFDSIIAAVVSGKVDFGMSGFTITEERKQNVDFSTPYTVTQQSVIVPVGSAITSVDDILNPENEYKIGVQIGTTGDLFISDDVELNGLKHTIERYNKYHDAVLAILSGKIDCIIVDEQVALSFVAAHDNLATLDTAYAVEEYAVCFAKNSELYADFNAALEELLADGTVETIFGKYIVEEEATEEETTEE